MNNTLDKLEKIASFYEELLASDLSLLSDDEKGTLREKKELLRKQVAEDRVRSDLIEKDSYPLEIAIVGSFKTGKSTVLNSLLGDEIVGMDVPPATAKVTTIKYGDEIGFFGVDKDDHLADIAHQDYIRLSTHSYGSDMKKKAKTQEQDYKRFEVRYPLDCLRKLHIMDTPGFSSESTSDDDVTKAAVANADVLLWVFDANRGSVSKEELDLLKKLTDNCSENTRICGIINRIDNIPTTEIPRVIEGFKKSLKGIIDRLVIYSGKEVLDMKKQSKAWEASLAELMDSMQKHCSEGRSVQATVSPSFISAQISFTNKTILDRKFTGIGCQDDYGFTNLSGVLEDWRKQSANIKGTLLRKSSAESLKEEKKALGGFIKQMKSISVELKGGISKTKKSVDSSAKKLSESIDGLGAELKEKLVTELRGKTDQREEVTHFWNNGYRVKVDMEDLEKIVNKHFGSFSKKVLSAAKTFDVLLGNEWRNGLDSDIELYSTLLEQTSESSLASVMYVFDNWTEVPHNRIDELNNIPLVLDGCIADELLVLLTQVLLKNRIEQVVENTANWTKTTVQIINELVSKAEATLNAC
jgi:ribosome biogenesis GTPase A